MTREWFEKVAYHALGHRTSQEMTYDIAKLALKREIPGDFVECGVYAGASSALMAKAILDHYAGVITRPYYCGPSVHLFDSFKGLPPSDPEDVEVHSTEEGRRGGQAAVPLEGVRANMLEWGIPDELLIYHPGWFDKTIPLGVTHGTISRIAVLRLDGDLGKSTRTPMSWLYPLVSPGGYIIADDYNLEGFRKAVHETVMPAPIYWRKEA